MNKDKMWHIEIRYSFRNKWGGITSKTHMIYTDDLKLAHRTLNRLRPILWINKASLRHRAMPWGQCVVNGTFQHSDTLRDDFHTTPRNRFDF